MSSEHTSEMKVTGMSCEHCVTTVKRAAESVPGVSHATVDLKTGTARVTGAFDRQQVVEAIEAAGYKAF